jgi:4-amino-4-deoxy-L-arabinose transferase-like glycosyltransferase
MSKENLFKYLIIILISLGAILRLTVFWVSPANNSYDDHLEVIKKYTENFSRPAPFQCWECYQPPLYYYVGASIYSLTELLGGTANVCWKMVQAINPLLSIILLIIAYQILCLYKLSKLSIAITLSFIIILPRDIFTSAMIGNDYMLVFFAVLAFYLFLKTINVLKQGRSIWKWIAMLTLTATLGSLTKQHGLLIHLFPGAIFLLLCKKLNRKKLYWIFPILFIGVLISLSEEAWKYSKTGEILVSNQHYFDYTKNQFPGLLDKVEFISFRIFRLYQDPFISENTSASFLTELFARTFYDYEWRFISPKIPWAKPLGYIAYSVGLIWFLFYLVNIFLWLSQSYKTSFQISWNTICTKGIPILLAILFMLVPLLQTLRYPYFSSMKSMFMLSGIIILLLTIGNLIKVNSYSQKLGQIMIVLNMIFGVVLVVSIAAYLGISTNHLHGPLWSFP